MKTQGACPAMFTINAGTELAADRFKDFWRD
jgi:hypothetical protein